MSDSIYKPPVTISIKECKACARQFYVGTKIIKLSPDDEIELVVQSFKCDQCRQPPDPRRPY